MGRRFHIKTLFNYALFAVVLFLAYKYFLEHTNQKPADPFRGSQNEHPKHFRHRPVHKKNEVKERPSPQIQKPPINRKVAVEAVVKEEEEVAVEAVVKQDVAEIKKEQIEEPVDDKTVKLDVGDIPKELFSGKKDLENLSQDEKETLQFQKFIKTNDDIVPKPESIKNKTNRIIPYFEDGNGLQLEEEMKERQAEFFKTLNEMQEEFGPDEFKNMVEMHDDITFVTAGSHSTYYSTVQFIYSIQYFYPESKIAIYDIGLTSEEKTFIGSLCNTVLTSLLLQLWPENLYKIRHRIWRPLLLQFAVVKFGHCVYVEPGRYIYRQVIHNYLQQSRIHGVIVGGKQEKYSTFFVTSPHMYAFIEIDKLRLQKTPHFEFTLIVLHNTKRVQHYFMRYLMACILHEYCISPPGAQPNCDKYGGSRKYGRCHHYDESAINLILNKWHDYSPREYLMKDLVTHVHDGNDMTSEVHVCNNSNKKEEV